MLIDVFELGIVMFISSRKISSSVFIVDDVKVVNNEVVEVIEPVRVVSDLDRLNDEFNKRKRVIVKGKYFGKKVGIKRTGSKVIGDWSIEKVRLIEKDGEVVGRQVIKGKFSKMEEVNRDINKEVVKSWDCSQDKNWLDKRIDVYNEKKRILKDESNKRNS